MAWLPALALAVQGALPAPAAALPAADQAGSGPAGPQQAFLPRGRRSGLAARVATLTRALGLDRAQQAELRKVLQDQRVQVQRIWSEPSVPAADRVAATRVLSARTADRIRAMLTEEQRKKYEGPPQGDPGEAIRAVHVEDWMKVDKKKQ